MKKLISSFLTSDHEITERFLAVMTPGIAPRVGKFPEYALPGIDRLLADAVVALYRPAHPNISISMAWRDAQPSLERIFRIFGRPYGATQY